MAENHEGGLTGPWRQIQGAIWLIGLAILFWQGWFWPGILVLVAISSITQAVIQLVVNKQRAASQPAPETSPQRDTAWLPAKCPQCGAPISASEVKWTSETTADCPYCGSNLKTAEQQ